MSNIFDVDPGSVEEPKDFSPWKSQQAELKCIGVEETFNEDKGGRQEVKLIHEAINPDGIETLDGGKAGKLYTTLYSHNDGSLKMFRRAVEAHGMNWSDFIAARDVNLFQDKICQAQINLETVRKDTGETLARPRNNAYFLLPKGATA